MDKTKFYKKLYNKIKKEKDLKGINLVQKIIIKFFFNSIQREILLLIDSNDYRHEEITKSFELSTNQYYFIFGDNKTNQDNKKYFNLLCEESGITYNIRKNSIREHSDYTCIVKCKNPYFEQNKTLVKKDN